MNYEDYPILKNEEYKLLNEKYSQTFTYDKNIVLHKICLNIQHCLNSCTHINSSFNKQILEVISNSKTSLEKTLNILKEIFSITIPTINETNNFNLFTYTKKIISTSELLITFINNEKKEYYKSIALKMCTELLKSTISLQVALENSSVHFFKHM